MNEKDRKLVESVEKNEREVVPGQMVFYQPDVVPRLCRIIRDQETALTQLRGREEEAMWLQRVEHACETERGVFMGMLDVLLEKWNGPPMYPGSAETFVLNDVRALRDKIARR